MGQCVKLGVSKRVTFRLRISENLFVRLSELIAKRLTTLSEHRKLEILTPEVRNLCSNFFFFVFKDLSTKCILSGPSESIFASYDPKASQTQEVSKGNFDKVEMKFLIMQFLAAKKNAKRKAAKARKAAETRVDPENEVIEDISCKFIKKDFVSNSENTILAVVAGLNQVKLKQEAEKSESKSEEDTLSELAALSPEEKQKNIKKRNKLLRQIEELESRKEKGEKLDSDQTKKLNRKDQVLKELEILNA